MGEMLNGKAGLRNVERDLRFEQRHFPFTKLVKYNG